MQATMTPQATLSEQDMLNDMLSCEKFIASSYTTMITEGSSQPLRQVLDQNMTQCLNDQFTVFQHMNQLGFYPLKGVQPQDIQTAKQRCQQMRQQM